MSESIEQTIARVAKEHAGSALRTLDALSLDLLSARSVASVADDHRGQLLEIVDTLRANLARYERADVGEVVRKLLDRLDKWHPKTDPDDSSVCCRCAVAFSVHDDDDPLADAPICSACELPTLRDLAACVRQQQAEIERLRGDILSNQQSAEMVQTERDARHRGEIEALRGEAERLKAAHDALAREVGKALVVLTLMPGEQLAEPGGHAIVHAMMRMRAEVEAERANTERRNAWAFAWKRAAHSWRNRRVYDVQQERDNLKRELVDARVVIGELETERNSLRAVVKSYEDADTGPVGRVEAEETPMTQGKKTLKDKMWRHALDVAPPSASHSRIITSACDFLADKVEELINQKGGDADARAKPGMDSPEHDANRPDVTPPPVGAARGEAPVCASCRQAMKHDGGPDYSCDECGTKHTLGPRKAGGEEYRPRLPPLALREVCKEWEDSLPRPSEWSSDMVRFLCNQYAGLGFRPRNRTWQSVETEAAARLGRMDAEAGRERMSLEALAEVLGVLEPIDEALVNVYRTAYADAIPFKPFPSRQQIDAANRLGARWQPDCTRSEEPSKFEHDADGYLLTSQADNTPTRITDATAYMWTRDNWRPVVNGVPIPWQRVGG